MSAPTPAAVRYAIACGNFTEFGKRTQEEIEAYEAYPDDSEGILRDHIRVVAAEMRAKAKATRLNTVDPFMSIAVRNAEISEAQLLERFADRLEGRES
jgi:hypothetical protein